MLEDSHPDLMRILALVNEGQIGSVHLRVGETEIFVSRLDEHAAGRPAAPPAAAPAPAVASPQPAAAPDPAPAATDAPEAAARRPTPPPVVPAADGRVTVRSPMVGLFYRAPDPGSDPYVDVGTAVAEETTVGLIEAMKVYTAVPAGVRGTVEEVLVENAQFVEFDQPLFAISTDGPRDG